MTSVALAGEHVVDQLDRALLPDRQRRQRVRVGDHVPERQHRQRRRQRPGAALADRLLEVGRSRRPGCRQPSDQLSARLDRDPAAVTWPASGSSTRRMPSS